MRLFILFCLIPELVLSQVRQGNGVKPESITTSIQHPGKGRLALVIGNSNYVDVPLKNPKNDADGMQKTLDSLGFDVMLYKDLGIDTMKHVVASFKTRLRGYEVGLFYFAGHGFKANGEDYLVSTDFRIYDSETDIRGKSFRLDDIVDNMEFAHNPTNIIIIDACRAPIAGRSGFSGWTRNEVSPGMAIFFAASSGNLASDNPTGNNGLFTQELLKQLKVSGLEFSQLKKNTINGVFKLSERKQLPYTVEQLLESFYFSSPLSIQPKYSMIRRVYPLKSRQNTLESHNVTFPNPLKMRHERRKFPYYGLAIVGLAAGVVTYMIINNKYDTYVNEINTRNSTYTNWYNAHLSTTASPSPPDSNFVHSVSKISFATVPIVSAGLSALGGVVMVAFGNKQARTYHHTDEELTQHPKSISFTPLLNPIQQYAGLSVRLHF